MAHWKSSELYFWRISFCAIFIFFLPFLYIQKPCYAYCDATCCPIIKQLVCQHSTWGHRCFVTCLRQHEVSEKSSSSKEKKSFLQKVHWRTGRRFYWIIFTFFVGEIRLKFWQYIGCSGSVLGREKNCPKAISLSFVDVSSLQNYKQATLFKTWLPSTH